MKFQMSPNIAVRTTQYSEAIQFYRDVLGFSMRSDLPNGVDLDAHPFNLFIIKDDEFRGPVMELFVEDIEKARDELVSRGCKVRRWKGKGQDCYIEDPFGVIYNIWEKKTE